MIQWSLKTVEVWRENMGRKTTYSVSELSKLAGVSVRTLHHYDQVGLLTPYRRLDNGYREYTNDHLISLQQIIIYRELDFSIDNIKQLLNVDNFDLLSALESQKTLLLDRQKKTNSMINSIEVTMTNIQSKRNVEIIFEDLPKEKLELWDALSQDAHGISMTNAGQRFLGNLSEDQARDFKAEGKAFTNEYVEHIDFPVESSEVQSLAKCYIQSINLILKNNSLEELDYEKLVAAAEAMMADPVAQEIYSFYHPDFAHHLGRAMLYFAEHNLKDSAGRA